MKKYFFFDIDGTLTDLKTHQIVPSAKVALEKLKQAGHFVCLNTGRAHYKAEKTRKEFNFENMVCNGGNGIVLDGILKENIPLDKQGAHPVWLGVSEMFKLMCKKGMIEREEVEYDARLKKIVLT